MTDDEFKARFIAAFKARCIAEWEWHQHEAEAEALDQFDDCGRADMVQPYCDDPELAANSAFDDYLQDLKHSAAEDDGPTPADGDPECGDGDDEVLANA